MMDGLIAAGDWEKAPQKLFPLTFRTWREGQKEVDADIDQFLVSLIFGDKEDCEMAVTQKVRDFKQVRNHKERE